MVVSSISARANQITVKFANNGIMRSAHSIVPICFWQKSVIVHQLPSEWICFLAHFCVSFVFVTSLRHVAIAFFCVTVKCASDSYYLSLSCLEFDNEDIR